MSQITLKPLDDGQKAVEIPIGKTTIGRGPLLGCSDKKVSRNHAVLEVTSKGEVYLTPTHVNPCFYQPTAESPGQILKKDTPHKLENGDSFSLLPRAYRYQLIVVGEEKEEENPDQNDTNKQCGKTNGSTVDGFEEEIKDPAKGVCNEELGDTSATEKPSSKVEDENVVPEKNHSKEENSLSKKLVDTTDDIVPPSTKETKKETEKEAIPSKENNVAEPKESENNDESTAEHSKVNDSSGENCANVEDRSKPSVDKVAEESESTCNVDTFSKNGASEVDDMSREEKTEVKAPEENLEDKRPENGEELQKEETLDMSPSKDVVSEAEEERQLPSRTEQELPPKRVRKKAAAAAPKQPNEVKTKRKADVTPKPKGRKKVPKFEFDPGEEGSSQKQVAGRTSSRTNRQTRQGLSLEDFIVSDDDEWQSDRSEPKQRRKRGSRRNDDSGSDWEVEHKKTKKPIHKLGSGSESGSDWGSHKKKKGGPRGKRRKGKNSEAGSEEETEPKPSSITKPRIPCTYGKKCYRRNQNHVEHFSHPGDSDYASEGEATVSKNDSAAAASEEEEASPKKECPYGANCFRKNPQHKKDFKHTKKVRPQREAAKQADKKTKSSRNNEEVDSYDLNDSFLNDDSDEYKPVDSGSDYESGEKMKRLAKAKAGKSKRGKKV